MPEDKKLVRICLEKIDKSAGNVWKSLIVGQYEADPFIFDQMQQKMTLERFQTEVRLLAHLLIADEPMQS